MLDTLFENSSQDCIVPIMFRADNGDQQNPVRSELVAFIANPSIESAAPLALRLQRSTNGTSGMGLMFVCIGSEGDDTRVLISRFPADEGVVAERSEDALNVEFVEQVFLKSANSYKAATYISNGRVDGLWKGSVVDKQINHGSKVVANYWIVDFLHSDFETTSGLGTKRLVTALKAASASGSTLVRQEIAAAAQLAGNIPNRAMSVAQFCDKFNFSEETKSAVLSKVDPNRLVDDRFRFDANEFERHLRFRQIELNNGALLTAPANDFNRVFQESVDGNMHTFVTIGEIVDERLRKNKS
ncbi:hypothetical protein [Methylophilus sp.]|uniref:hypothetical protein n=1 Tax=Methylophilus sp. TaxID=29541 RepID=UPI000D4DC544|nr:hypothetical protein [Methylophilus sp.]PPD12460.1 MAG: hypothetical protein CTY26_04230 [Methylophilus sp.]